MTGEAVRAKRRFPGSMFALLCVSGFFVLFSFVLFAPVATAADSDVDKERERLEDVKKKLKETGSSIERVERKETSVLDELSRIAKSLKTKRSALRKLDGRIKAIVKNVKVADRNIGELAKEKQGINKRLEKRLRAMYKMRSGGMAKVAFSIDSSSDSGRKIRYMTRLMDYDKGLIDEAEANLAKSRSEKERLSRLEKDLRISRQTASVKKKEAESTRRKKRSLLASVKREKKAYLKMEAELTQAQDDLLELINKLTSGQVLPGVPASGFEKKKGRLSRPVRGLIVSSFGKVTHPKFKTVTFNNGIVIKAKYGTKVRSVYQGRVVYVGWLRGYGQVMIVDNGGSYYTLFAYLSEILKKRGDNVEESEVVGLVGDSGPEEVTGLYFEIRKKGTPRDPKKWLAKR